MTRAALPKLEPDEQILLTGKSGFDWRGELLGAILVIPVLWLISFLVFNAGLQMRGASLPIMAQVIVTGGMVLLGVMILWPAVWMAQRGRVWSVTNQRIIDNKGLILPISRIRSVSRRGVIRGVGFAPLVLPGADGKALWAVLQPLLTRHEQFASVLPPGDMPAGVPHPTAQVHAALWAGRLLPGEILLWAGQAGRLRIVVMALMLLAMTLLSLMAVAETYGWLPCQRARCPGQGFGYLVLLLGCALCLTVACVHLIRPTRYAVTDRRVMVVVTALQDLPFIKGRRRELPILGASFHVERREMWLFEAASGPATRKMTLHSLGRAQTRDLEKLLFALIRRSATQAFHRPPR